MKEIQGTAAMPGGWLAVLCAVLVVVEPSIFAWRASSGLTRVLSYGAPAVLLLGLRLVVVGLGVSAGLAIWLGRPHGVAMARGFFVLSLVGSVVTVLTPYFPANRPPGTLLPLLTAVALYHAGWLVYLFRSRRVACLLNG